MSRMRGRCDGEDDGEDGGERDGAFQQCRRCTVHHETSAVYLGLFLPRR